MQVEQDSVSLGQFEFACGQTVPDLEVAYTACGEFSGANAVLVCHALTGSAHVAGDGEHGETVGQAQGWWDAIVGPGKPIDTEEFYVICANVPGSCYGSTGPTTENPTTGEPYATEFPPVTVRDWTEAQRLLLDALDISDLEMVVGGSVGGMNVLEWAKRYPERVDKIAPIATATRLDPQSLALDAVARRAITSDENWCGGQYYGGDPPAEGLALARQIGHVMYLSKTSMNQKFGRQPADRAANPFPTDPGASFFPYRDVESYLDYQADQFVERFDANSYLYLTRAMDNYDLSGGVASDAAALAAFQGEALVMSFTADWHFTTAQAESLADAMRATGVDVAHQVVDSDYGHDAFLVETEKVGPPLRAFLSDGTNASAVTDTGQAPTSKSAYAPVHASLFSD